MFDWSNIVYIIGQVLGVVAILLGFLAYQTRTQKGLLLVHLANCAVFAAHYGLIGATAGMVLNGMGVVRDIAYYYRDRQEKKTWLLPILFGAVFAVAGAFTWEAWYSVFVFAGLIINTLCLGFSDPQNVRKSILVTSPLVLIYDVFARSYGGVVYESIAIISAIIGMVRFYKGKNVEEGEA